MSAQSAMRFSCSGHSWRIFALNCLALGLLCTSFYWCAGAQSLARKHQGKPASTAHPPSAALFVVSNDLDLADAVKRGESKWQKDDPDQDGTMELLATIRGGKLRDLPTLHNLEALNDESWFNVMRDILVKFAPRMKKLTLIHAGAAVGEATSLLGETTSYEDVAVKLSLPDRSIENMIGISSVEAVHLHENRAEQVTAEDRAAVLRAAHSELLKNKVPVVNGIQIDSIHSARLSTIPMRSVLAGVSYTDKKHFCHLLLILDYKKGKYTVSNVYISLAKNDQDSRHIVVYDPIDQLDIDGDGVDEVLVQVTYYEGGDFFILQHKNGKWRAIYETNTPILDG